MSEQYPVPKAQLSLSGAVVFPEVGQLPLRGDLAHIALADRFLIAQYAVPQPCKLTAPSPLRLSPDKDAEVLAELKKGQAVELLDIAGSWTWVCLGPEGPAGYVPVELIEE